MKYLIIAILFLSGLSGCSVTSRLERKQYNANVEHIPKKLQSEKVKKKKVEGQKFLELKSDSGSFFFVPARLVDSFMTMRIDVGDVTITSSYVALPERSGKLNINFIVLIPKELQGNCRNVIITPLLHKLDKNIPLENLTIKGELFRGVQNRNYWQYQHSKKDSVESYRLYMKYPFSENVKLDSVIESKNNIAYHYTQEVKLNDDARKLDITLEGKVIGLDGSSYKLPKSDTVKYTITSMLNFIDNTPRYIRKIVDKYVVVNDRNYLSFKLNNTKIIDTLNDNKAQLERIEGVMNKIITQKEFHVDSIILTASSSPEGAFAHNNRLSKNRSISLKKKLISKFGKKADSLITTRWIAEDWSELIRLIELDSIITNKAEILKVIAKTKSLDKREQAIRRLHHYKYIKEKLYPQLRAVNFKYDLRRVGMIKDTIHTTEIDTLYLKGINLLKSRQYAKAMYILDSYNDFNSAIVAMSLEHNDRAYEILSLLEETDKTAYLKAIICSRLGNKAKGREYFIKACNLNESMEYRGNLDPEISELLKL